MIAFRVPGLPIAQGSKRHVGRGVLIESAKDLKPWRDAVILCAQRATGYARPCYDQPVTVLVEFTFPTPKKRVGEVRMATRPDVEKLCRAIADSLEAAQIVVDDGRISDLVAIKRYGPEPGAYICVSTGELDLAHIVQHARATEPLELNPAA